MKFSKKMIMIPEAEYNALVNLFSGGDSFKAEKASTEAKMASVIRNPRLTELVKGKKYDMLYKKRRQLKKIIENRSQNTGTTSQQLPIPPLQEEQPPMPTTGIVPAQVPQTPLQQIQKSRRIAAVKRNIVVKRKNRPRIRRNKETPDLAKALSPFSRSFAGAQIATALSPFSRTAAQTAENIPSPSVKVYKSSIRPGIINKGLTETLKNLLNEQKAALGIKEDGTFYRSLKDKNPIKDSNIDSVTAYFTGQSVEAETPGIYYIYQRLSKDPKFQEILKRSNIASISSAASEKSSQSGKGIKKYIIKKAPTKNIKTNATTKGLTRIRKNILNTNKNSSNKFKPRLWVKLGL